MRVALGVCGGIAAYKAAELVRLLQGDALEVEVVMTSAAQRFVTPLTFAALSSQRVITGLWDEDGEAPNLNAAIEHIAVAQRIQALVVAPATADMLAKFAHGMADDFLSTLYLATKAPIVVAPAMNVNMWEHAATQKNLATLRERGVRIVEPGEGYLACGMVGAGRMAEQAQIAAALRDVVARQQDFAGKTVLVTAGGTREALDPVRFLGNRSSGKMGYAIAAAAAARGAEVVLISAPTGLAVPPGVRRVDVTSSAEMRDAVMRELGAADIVFKAAAVSDFRPAEVQARKMKRKGPMTIALEPTADILAEISARKNAETLLIGFAAETDDARANAEEKLERKNVDAIVLNDVSAEGIGFDSDENAVTWISRGGAVEFAKMSKRLLAERLLDQALELARVRGRQTAVAAQ